MAGSRYHFTEMRTARVLMACAVLFVLLDVLIFPWLASLGGYGVVTLVGLTFVTLGVVYMAVEHSDELGIMYEINIRRRFRAVCREKGLTTKDANGKLVYPPLVQLMGHGDVVSACIRPLFGQSVADWDRAADAFSMAYGVPGVRFRDKGDGTVAMVAGYERLEARQLVVNEEAVMPTVGMDWRAFLATVVVGTTEAGQTFALPFLGSHILVAGKTGAGKGSVIWSLVLGLVPACRAGVVRFWGLDPKRLELRIGRDFFGDRYATNEEQSVALLERAVSEMFARGEELAGRARKVEPSERYPVEVIILDELGFTSSMLTDRKLQQRAEKALTTLLMLGRATGFVVVGALQDPRKETLSQRDLFPTRVAMRLDKPMVDLVLGHGAHEAGARCEQIPNEQQGGAGLAFVQSEHSGDPVCVRFTWCPDDLIRNTARLLAPPDDNPQLAS